MRQGDRDGHTSPRETLSRRGFMIVAGAAVLAGTAELAAGQAPAAAPPPIPGKEKLTIRSSRPINLETPLAELTSYDTPDNLFFVRNNLDSPVIDPAQWGLRVEGEVDQPLLLRLDELRKLPMVTEDVLIECAGNGRAFHRPRTAGLVGDARPHDQVRRAHPARRQGSADGVPASPLPRPRRPLSRFRLTRAARPPRRARA